MRIISNYYDTGPLTEPGEWGAELARHRTRGIAMPAGA